LYTESIKANVDGLTILVAPKSSVLYNADRDKKENREKKLADVKKLLEQEKEKSNFSNFGTLFKKKPLP